MLPFSFHSPHLVWLVLLIPLFGIIGSLLVPSERKEALELVSFGFSVASLMVSVLLIQVFDASEVSYQLVTDRPLISTLGVRLALGVDGLGLWMIVFTNILMVIAVFQSRHIAESRGGFVALLFLLQFAVVGTFLVLDLILYYVFWELMLIPNFFLLYRWGSNKQAAIKYALYTALGSFVMLVSIISLGILAQEQRQVLSFFLGDLVGLMMTERMGDLLFFGFLAGFFLKSAVFPFHSWLPDAHRAAPPGGSFDLTLVLPKMGLFGAIRFVYLLLPDPMVRHEHVLALLGVVGLLYAALVAWKQTDLKRFLAYSTISHVGLAVVGFASLSEEGVKGCVFLMLGSGIATGGLLLLVSTLERRCGVQSIDKLGGLASSAPRMAFLFSLFIMASIGVPLTNGFIGEFLAIAGIFDSNDVLGMVTVLGVVFAAVYGLSIYRQVFFGEPHGKSADLELRDFVPLVPLAGLVFLLGLYPRPILVGVEHTLDLMDAIQEGQIALADEGAPQQNEESGTNE